MSQICFNCGAELSEHEAICHQCGQSTGNTPLASQPTAFASPPPPTPSTPPTPPAPPTLSTSPTPPTPQTPPTSSTPMTPLATPTPSNQPAPPEPSTAPEPSPPPAPPTPPKPKKSGGKTAGTIVGVIAATLVVIMGLSFAAYLLFIGNGREKASVNFENTGVYYTDVVEYLSNSGYSYTVVKSVDVTDYTGDEYLCVAKKDGVWYMLIFVYQTTSPHLVTQVSLEENSNAYYITQAGGQQCLLRYNQNIYAGTDNNATTYNYCVYRLGEDDQEIVIDQQEVKYDDKQTTAGNVSQFFDSLNGYIVQVVVVHDPYCLKGYEWIPAEACDYSGSYQLPQTASTSDDDTAPRSGYVSIKDADSWLNLREGPGTQYKRVLVDPTNSKSFIRQANGAPVTILEEVETGDKKNPVWVKVKITYHNQEYIGYSSKTYIKEYE